MHRTTLCEHMTTPPKTATQAESAKSRGAPLWSGGDLAREKLTEITHLL
jgi:hypothetical protein